MQKAFPAGGRTGDLGFDRCHWRVASQALGLDLRLPRRRGRDLGRHHSSPERIYRGIRHHARPPEIVGRDRAPAGILERPRARCAAMTHRAEVRGREVVGRDRVTVGHGRRLDLGVNRQWRENIERQKHKRANCQSNPAADR